MAVGDAYVFPGFLTPVLTNFSFQSHRLLFSHASAEVRGKNTLERKVASTGDQTHNHQVMSLTRSPLSHPGGALWLYISQLLTRLFPIIQLRIMAFNCTFSFSHHVTHFSNISHYFCQMQFIITLKHSIQTSLSRGPSWSWVAQLSQFVHNFIKNILTYFQVN